MTCTRQFLGFQWERHTWQPRVTFAEIVVGDETNMWARVVQREFVRCDKHEVCTVCGKTRRAVSCMCDMERGAGCAIRNAHLAESR